MGKQSDFHLSLFQIVGAEVRHFMLLGSLSKPRRLRRGKRHHTKGSMSKTLAVHVRFESWYISLPSPAKQQREMTKFYVFWRTRNAMPNF